jgi:hypothetical protein
MRASVTNTTASQPGQLASRWALGFLGATSTGFRRMLSPWAYKHLRGLAAVHFATGVLLAGVAVGLLSHGFYGWAILPLAGMAAHFGIGYADIAVARSVPSRG